MQYIKIKNNETPFWNISQHYGPPSKNFGNYMKDPPPLDVQPLCN